MTSLSDWADAQKTYIRIEEGQTIAVKFLSYRFKEDRFNPEKQTVEYKFELSNGQEKTWDNGSSRVAEKFGLIKPGEWVKISRTGNGPKTVYLVKKDDEPATDLTEEVNPEDIPL